MKKTMAMWEEECLKTKKKEKQPGNGPKTSEENSQGKDPWTLEENIIGGGRCWPSSSPNKQPGRGPKNLGCTS